MGKVYFIFGVLVVFFCISNVTVASDDCEELSDKAFFVNVKMEQKNSLKMTLRLTNSSKETLDFYDNVLSRDFLTLVAVKGGGYEEKLKDVWMIEDYSMSIIRLKPGENFSHIIHLDQYFPSLNNVLKKTNVILFWSIEVKTTPNHNMSERSGGYLVLQKM